ncbi:MAG: sugar transferase [Chloroflexi bacterium]|nr:sugar transferase [Chloroflexota bacterium]
MLERSSTRYLVLLYVTDMLATAASLALAGWARSVLPFGKELTPLGLVSLPLYGLVLLTWTIIFLWLSAYSPRRLLNPIEEAQHLVVSITASMLVLAGMLYFTYRGLSRLLLGYFYLIDLVLVIVGRRLIRAIYKATAPPQSNGRRILIVGAGQVGQDLANRLSHDSWIGLNVVGYLDDDPAKIGTAPDGYPVLASLDKARQVIQENGIDEVIIALPLWAYEVMKTLVATLQELPVNIKVVPDFFALTLFSATLEDVEGIPLIGIKEPVIRGLNRWAKRAMDLIAGSILLVLISPVMLVTAILIKLDSKGPIFYRQERVGEGGKLFRMVKFRTMRQDADKLQAEMLVELQNGQKVFNKRPDDPRITRIGHFLRKRSIDELPQLINVLRGEMSLVGPRPEMPFLVATYEPWQRQRFGVPQGMTGWWQINDRSDKPMHLHTEDDLYYIQHYSLLLDLKILWRTIGAVLKGRGAY